MATDIFINKSTKDLDIVNGQLRLTGTKQELIRQRLSITLSAYRGEWFANTNYGIPYLENETVSLGILGKSNKDVVDFEVKNAISETEGVVEIVSYSSVVDNINRQISVNFQVLAESGEIIDLSLEL
jgi:hypothetical protein